MEERLQKQLDFALEIEDVYKRQIQDRKKPHRGKARAATFLRFLYILILPGTQPGRCV